MNTLQFIPYMLMSHTQLTLIEEDLRLKIELQNVKHQFAGLLDNFRSFDRALEAAPFAPIRSATERVDDARARVRALYASKRARLQLKQRTEDKENDYRQHQNTPTSRATAPYTYTRPNPSMLCDSRRSKYLSMIRNRSDANNETSAWSDDLDSLSPAENLTKPEVNINDISYISGKRVNREHSSGSNISGAFHSTFNYPLHSTLNYPLHSTILDTTPEFGISHLNRSKTLSGKRRLFPDDDDDEGMEEIAHHHHQQSRDVTLASSRDVSMSRDEHILAAGYVRRVLKRQTGQAHLSDDAALYRKQMTINETVEETMNNTLVSSNNATCHSMPDISPTSHNSTVISSKLLLPQNKSSSTNASSAPPRAVPRNSPITDQSTSSSVVVTSSRRSSQQRRRGITRPACLRPLTTSVLIEPPPAAYPVYSLQKCTSVRLRDRAMRKNLKRKMRRFNEDITKLDTNPYDVLVYL